MKTWSRTQASSPVSCLPGPELETIGQHGSLRTGRLMSSTMGPRKHNPAFLYRADSGGSRHRIPAEPPRVLAETGPGWTRKLVEFPSLEPTMKFQRSKASQ